MNSTVLLQAVDIAIPGYRILRTLGQGGMASVFLAVQESLDREVALKVMAPALAANPEFAERFLKEGKLTAKLQHPNVVTIHDIGVHNGIYYLSAEFIPRGTLKERITDEGLSVGEALNVLSDIAHGLDYAHEKGVVHRDVKPGNVLFRKDGRAVLADFGIAKAMDGGTSSTMAGMSVGTPDYMSPEQARGEPVDGRSDLYSLGVMLYEMLTGKPPYEAPDAFSVALSHITEPIPTLPPQHAWLQPLLNGLMSKMAGERYNTGAAVIAAIQRMLPTAPPGAVDVQAFEAREGMARSTPAATQQRTRVSDKAGKDSAGATSDGNPWPLRIGLGVAAAAVVSVLLWAPWRAPEPVTVPSLKAETPIEGPGVAAFERPGSTSTAGSTMSADEIDLALRQAEAYLHEGTQVAGSEGKGLRGHDDTALGKFQTVLAADPTNARATSGVETLAAYYRDAAGKMCASERWVACAMVAGYGLEALPDDPELLKLKEAAEAAQRGL
jgi:tRNA A-37 threonylcarbamoyl transferase component Bud32